MHFIDRSTQVNQIMLKEYLKKGMKVVDCTVGNGHDSRFLLDAIGDDGFLIGFDVQKDAIENTEANLKDQGHFNFRLINSGHEKLKDYINEDQDVFVYNLGYLPKYDKSITTMTETTIESLRQAMSLLKNGGLISITAYPGHEEGLREYQTLDDFLASIDQKKFNILKMQFINQVNNPPVVFMLEKKIT